MDGPRGRFQRLRSLEHPHNLHLAIPLDEEDQIALMNRMPQPFVQIVAFLKAAEALSNLHNLRSISATKGRGAGRVVERNIVANVDEVCPCSGQDNQFYYA